MICLFLLSRTSCRVTQRSPELNCAQRHRFHLYCSVGHLPPFFGSTSSLAPQYGSSRFQFQVFTNVDQYAIIYVYFYSGARLAPVLEWTRGFNRSQRCHRFHLYCSKGHLRPFLGSSSPVTSQYGSSRIGVLIPGFRWCGSVTFFPGSSSPMYQSAGSITFHIPGPQRPLSAKWRFP